jgi:hypothetical protein
MKQGVISAVLAVSALGCAQPARADIVIDWADFANRLNNKVEQRTPVSIAANAQLAIAMFEAANAVDHRYQSYLGIEPVPPGASKEAALMAAAHAVLSACYPDQKGMIDENYAVAIEQVPNDAARQRGIAIGEAVAAKAMTHGAIDKSIAQQPYRPVTSAGMWIGAQLPVFDPWFQALQPFAIGRVDALRPPPPPAVTSARYAKDFDEVKRLGGKNSTERTEHQSRMARYRITPDLMPMLRRISDLPGRSTVQNARMFARVAMTEFDEGLAMVDAKMHYQFWRPITAIRDADQDGNDATTRDAEWAPYINTPNHPEYPCGHCGYASAMATVLKAEVGNAPPGGVEVASESIPDSLLQRLPTFDDWVREVSFSRTLGGVHYRFSNEAAQELGRRAAEKVLALMPEVPRRERQGRQN